MRRTVTNLALALCLVGCGAAPVSTSDAFELPHGQGPANGRNGVCSLGWWTSGRLVVDGNGGTSIIVEGGDFGTVGAPFQVLWWPGFTGRRVGSEVEILDPDGKVIATTGRRYRIRAAFPFRPAFVVCGDEVTPL